MARIQYQSLYHGEAKAVVINMKQYEQMQETMAMLEIMAQAKQDIAEGKFRPAQEVFRDLKDRISKESA